MADRPGVPVTAGRRPAASRARAAPDPVAPGRTARVDQVVPRHGMGMTAGPRERSAPDWPRRLTPSPRCGSVAPGGSVEVATVVIAAPRTLSARAAVAGTTWPARAAVVPGSALAVEAAGRRPAVAGTARSAMVATRIRWWGSGISVRHTGARTRCRREQRAGDSSPGDQLLEFHSPSPTS